MTALTFLETLLSASGSPFDLYVILQEAAGRWNEQTITNALQGDPRFVRNDRNRYGLTIWGLSKYEGISKEIRKLIEAEGPLHIDQVVLRLRLRFDIEESSIRAYALDVPFNQIDGVVSLMEAESIEAPKFVELLPKQTENIKVIDQGFEWLVKVNSDHLRGSGFNAKIAIASILGMSSGRTKVLKIQGSDFELKVNWKKRQPHIGSIKSPLSQFGAKEGDKLSIIFVGSEGSIESVKFSILP
jgi:hypothetical protein